MHRQVMLFVRMIFTLGFFYYFVQAIISILSSSDMSTPLENILGMAVFYGLGVLITYQLSRLNPPVTPREVSERQMLMEKLTKEVTLALDKQIDSVYIVVEKKMHPTAGVYYDVITRQD